MKNGQDARFSQNRSGNAGSGLQVPDPELGGRRKKKTKHGKRQVNISLKLLLTYILGSNPYFGLQ